MKQLASILAGASVCLGLVACSSDDPVTPTPDASYMPKTAGTYYINQNTAYDTEGNVAGTYADSVHVNGTKTIDGKTAVELITYTSMGDEVVADTTYRAEEGSKIYEYVTFSYDLDEDGPYPPIELGKRWVLGADANATGEWTAIDETIENLSFSVPDFPTPLTGSARLIIKASKVESSTQTINGVSVETIHYKQVMDATATFGGGLVSIPLKFTTHTWFGKNVGLVRAESEKATITAAVIPTPIVIPASSSVLVRYSVK